MSKEIDWNYLDLRLRRKQQDLAKAEELKNRRQRMELRLKQATRLLEECQSHQNSLKCVKARAMTENNEFHQKRLAYLDQSITEAINEIFPDKKLKATISCDFRKRDRVDLFLTDEQGLQFKPHMSNGKLMQYLISFSAVSKIIETLGYHNLYIDEAFGVASENNLPRIGEIIEKQVNAGTQIVLVSQNSSLYQDVARHEIHLEYDAVNKRAVLVKTEDYEKMQ